MRPLDHSATTIFPIPYHLLFPNYNFFLDFDSFCQSFSFENLMNLFNQELKPLFDIEIAFCTDFYKRNSIFLRYLRPFFFRNLPFKIKITFRSKKNLTDIWWSMCLNLLHPSLYILEGCSINDRISQYYPCSPFIVSLCNILESFLPCSIPDL